MAATSYTIHKTTDIDGISLVVPDGKKINVSDDDNKTITVTIPSGTVMKMDSSGEYFNFNFCAYIAVVFNNGTQKPSASVISTINGKTSAPSTTNYKTFCNQVILFHRGQSEAAFGRQFGWSHALSEDKTITITAPSGATDYTAYVCGCSMGTPTYRKFYFDPYVNGKWPSDDTWSYTDYSWSSLPSPTYVGDGDSRVWNVGGNSCGHTHTSTEFAATNALWGEISRGTISTLIDNKNKTVTVSGTRPKSGSNNALTTSTLVVTFGDGSTNTYNFKTAGHTNGGSYSYTINLPSTCPLTVSAELTSAAPHTASGTVSKGPVSISYSAPAAPTNLTWSSPDSKNPAKPIYKNNLTWSWTASTGGGDNTSVDGYRIFIFRNRNGTTSTVQVSGKYTGSIEESGNKYYELTGCSLTFNPKDGCTPAFKGKDYCNCMLFTYGWGNDGTGKTQLFSSAVTGSCLLYNNAVVWVCAPKSSSDPTLVWKEGTVYVHNGTTWKEAEGVYVHNGSSWKESN
jgi:hypothetical protein